MLMAAFFCERFYTRSWLCLAILFFICIGFNMVLFYDSFKPFRFVGKTHILNLTTVTDISETIPIVRSSLIPLVPSTKNPSSLQKHTDEVINLHNFRYLINEPDICKTSPDLIIIVCTAVKNFKERRTIRDTWGSAKILNHNKSKLVFLFGTVKSKQQQESLLNESKHYGDIIQEDFMDSYQNLSLKSVALLKWVSNFCMSSKFVLKADDDMYVNIPNLLKALLKVSKPKFILGFIFEGAKPIQDKRSKWYTPLKQFSEKIYPKYVSGTAYSMTTSCVPDLFKASLQIKTFWLEDIYVTGLLARKANIDRLHSSHFSYLKRPATGCAFRDAITGHDYSIAEQIKIHKELYNVNITCKT